MISFWSKCFIRQITTALYYNNLSIIDYYFFNKMHVHVWREGVRSGGRECRGSGGSVGGREGGRAKGILSPDFPTPSWPSIIICIGFFIVLAVTVPRMLKPGIISFFPSVPCFFSKKETKWIVVLCCRSAPQLFQGENEIDCLTGLQRYENDWPVIFPRIYI